MAEIIQLSADVGLSSREINRARRKARQAVHKQRSREHSIHDESSNSSPSNGNTSKGPPEKKIKLDCDQKIKEEWSHFAGNTFLLLLPLIKKIKTNQELNRIISLIFV